MRRERINELIHRASQKERIELIILALTNKIGKEALGHYGLSSTHNADPSLNTLENEREGRVEVEAEADPGGGVEEDGLHL
jgi:hypothetical protein